MFGQHPDENHPNFNASAVPGRSIADSSKITVGSSRGKRAYSPSPTLVDHTSFAQEPNEEHLSLFTGPVAVKSENMYPVDPWDSTDIWDLLHQELPPPTTIDSSLPQDTFAIMRHFNRQDSSDISSEPELDFKGYKVLHWEVAPWDLKRTSKTLADQLSADLDALERYTREDRDHKMDAWAENKSPPMERKKRRKVGDTIAWEPIAPGQGLGCCEIYKVKRNNCYQVFGTRHNSFMGLLNMRSLRAWSRKD
ncbi:unnamed protein product [Kuraishia capsulata CBS 1993]|uniref:Uncharacterized protein n=1 Tax=Kuraishia capsulata CBS 1993 TaxID=1382522 RepID=W6MR48_9ASCO|nr:uncharacterized protein KUCA_T00003696001 [Kuraishia capsulata CBS 1993]CDK27717.1 unnamed protein product [Kuraishia capsulata CBS 1993]